MFRRRRPDRARGRSGHDHRAAGVRRAVVEPAVWWATLSGIYLAVISKISATELLVGAAAAALGAAAAVVTRRVLLSDLAIARPPLRALLLPPQILRDCLVLLRPTPRGRFAKVPLPSGEGGGVMTLILSTSPGTYVARVLPDRDVVVVHRAGDRPSLLEREMTSCSPRR